MGTLFISKKHLILGCIFSGLIVFVVFVLKSQRIESIVMCDVGQGDGIYMRLKDNVDVVIDVGPDEKMLECLGNEMGFLDNVIEYLFISHAHFDHYGGLESVLNHYIVKHVYLTQAFSGSKTFNRLVTRMEKNSDVHFVVDMESVSINSDVMFHIVWPNARWLSYQTWETENEQYLRKSTGDLNAFSLVIYTQIHGVSLLLTGDVTDENLMTVLPLIPRPIAILKAPHHGSKTSLNKDILESLRPALTLISVASKNSYGLPSPEVVGVLDTLRLPYKMTSREGSIRVDFLPTGWKLHGS